MAHPTEIAISQLRRTTNSQTVLAYIAAAFLLLFGAFWYVVWALFLRPPSLLSPQAIITLVLTLCYTVVWPLFGSMAIPNSPARHFLQKQTWAVPGSIAVVAITILLGRFAFSVFMQWVGAQPGIEENPDIYWPAVIGVFVGAFFVPVLCWAAATPEQVVAQIEQALWIKDMERAAKLRERVWRAADIRAQAIIHAGMIHGALGLAQREELAGLMLASHRTLQQGLRMVALTMDESASIEDLIPSTPDKELVQLYQQVPAFLGAATEQISGVMEVVEATPVDQRLGRLETRSATAAPRSAAPQYAAEYATAIQRLQPFFTVRQVGELLGDSPDRTAHDVVNAWHAQGWVEKGNIRGQWHFLDEGA